MVSRPSREAVLVSLGVGLGCVLEPSGILNGDGVALGGLVATAGLDGSLGDTHDAGWINSQGNVLVVGIAVLVAVSMHEERVLQTRRKEGQVL